MTLLAIAGLLTLAAAPPVEDQYYCTTDRKLAVGQVWIVQSMSLKRAREPRGSGWFSAAGDVLSVRADWTGEFVAENGKLALTGPIYDLGPAHRYRIEIRRDGGDTSSAIYLSSPLQSPENRSVRFYTKFGVITAMMQGVDRLNISIIRDDGTIYKTGVWERSAVEDALRNISELQLVFETRLADPEANCLVIDPDNLPIIDAIRQ